MKKYKVYVAGPISKGDLGENVRRALTTANELCREGFIPFIPQLSVLWALIEPPSGVQVQGAHNFWLPYDLEWVAACDALLRLPGDSIGADAEVAFATSRKIPVFHGIAALMRWRDEREF